MFAKPTQAVVGEGDVEAIGDWADDGEFGPVDDPASADGLHCDAQGVHREKDLAIGCDGVHDSADIGGVEIVFFEKCCLLVEIDH